METVSVSEAKATLSRLVQRALAGETITIGRRGVPEVVLTAVHHDPSPRPLGTWGGDEGGKYWMADDFDEPDNEIADLFENSVIFPEDA